MELDIPGGKRKSKTHKLVQFAMSVAHRKCVCIKSLDHYKSYQLLIQQKYITERDDS